MAAVINIAGQSGVNSQDSFYRYKMPQLLVKVEGKGNGIKTVIPNMVDIAKALARPPTYPTKFFGCELGAQTTFDEKNERYIVNGAHDASRLRELLAGFIDKFVLCPSCKNPETDLHIDGKKQIIFRDCKACGHRQDVDMKHKLTTFILRNPPETAKSSKKGSTAESKSKKGRGKKGANEGVDSPKAEDDGAMEAGSDDELTRQIVSGAADISVDDKDDEEGSDGKGDKGWSIDTSAEAVARRQKQLQAGVQSLLQADDDEEGGEEDSPYTAFESWVAQEARDGSASDVEIYKKLEEMKLVKKYKVLQYLVQGLFTPENIVSQEEVEKHAALFKKIIMQTSKKDGSTEKSLKAILGGIEYFVGILHPDLADKAVFPKVLMAFYQADILDDEELLKHWGTHVSKKYTDKSTCKKVKKAAEPFLKWLEEQDDDEDEEEEKEDDGKDEADSA